MNKELSEFITELAPRDGKPGYWKVDAACLMTASTESELRTNLIQAAGLSGVDIWWDDDYENTGEYHFAIKICDAHFKKHVHQSKPICTCEGD